MDSVNDQISSLEAFGTVTVEGRELQLRGGPGRGGSRSWETHYAEATVDKSTARLRGGELDLGFSGDHPFKNTCADFDERSAHGVLMNHLSLGAGIDEGGFRAVFNASDTVAKSGDGEEVDLLRLFG